MKIASLVFALALGMAAQTTRTVTVVWTAASAPSGATGVIVGYNVFRGTTSAGPFTQLNTSLVSGLSYLDTTPVVGQTYTYYVTAYAGVCPAAPPAGQTLACGTGSPGPMASLTVQPAPSAVGSMTLVIP